MPIPSHNAQGRIDLERPACFEIVPTVRAVKRHQQNAIGPRRCNPASRHGLQGMTPRRLECANYPQLALRTDSERSPLHDVRQHATPTSRRLLRILFHFWTNHSQATRPHTHTSGTGKIEMQQRCTIRTRRTIPIWWSQTGSNRRPPACKAGALPAELWPLSGVRTPLGILTSARLHAAPTVRQPACLVMVGLGGLEPPTSRLSSARSNQLSYKPDFEGSDTDAQGQHPCRLSSVVRNLSSEKARPRRKRNVDGGVPQIRDQTAEHPKTPASYPVMFLSAGNESNLVVKPSVSFPTS
jgi:hypothetical protein